MYVSIPSAFKPVITSSDTTDNNTTSIILILLIKRYITGLTSQIPCPARGP